MVRVQRLGVFVVTLVFLLLSSAVGLLLVDQRRDADDDQELNKAILEMLHMDKVSASHQFKAHPYMRRIYQQLDSLEAQDFGRSDGTLVQSFRSFAGPPDAPHGWIWFNISSLTPSMLGAELVLFRKTLHPRPLSVTVALHSATLASGGRLDESPALEERQLTLDQRPDSGYDVFDVSSIMTSVTSVTSVTPATPVTSVTPATPATPVTSVTPATPVTSVTSRSPEVLGFQLRYTDENGSLVLHQALTQSLYCLDRGSLREPLLVLYQDQPLHV